MQLYYDVHDGTGPYVLLVHGFLSSRAQWRPNLAALASVMRPVVVELPSTLNPPAIVDEAFTKIPAAVLVGERVFVQSACQDPF